MNRIVIGSALKRHVSSGTAMLLFILLAAGCERSPTASGRTSPPAQGGFAEAKPVADAPVQAAPTTATGQTEAPANTTQATAASQASETPRKLIAYYFHRTMRCATCLSIEKQSREAIELAYGGELSSGRLEWHAVNIEEPGNEHFEKDFELQTQSLVLVEMSGEPVTRWKLLPKVWELVEDPYGFQEYVANEVALFLGGG